MKRGYCSANARILYWRPYFLEIHTKVRQRPGKWAWSLDALSARRIEKTVVLDACGRLDQTNVGGLSGLKLRWLQVVSSQYSLARCNATS